MPEFFDIFFISHEGVDFQLYKSRKDGSYISLQFESETGDLLIRDENLQMVLAAQDNDTDAILALGDYIGA